MIRLLFLMSVTVATASAVVPQSLRGKYANAYRETPELIEHYGYPAETHSIITEDGYILTLHRIPGDPTATNYKGPVVFIHGIVTTSSTWVIVGSNSFAFLLSEEGYDVWLPNLRGNYYSRSHVNISKDDPKFWDFSYHESGIYDVPAITDYVLSKAKSKDLTYICHSMGCTVPFVMLSLKPEYNEKIRAFIGLAPAVAALSHATSVIVTVAATVATFREQLRLLGVGEMFPKNIPDTDTRVLLCAEENVATRELCNAILFYAYGGSRERINQTNVANLAGHIPAGTGRDVIAHYGQGHISGRFAQFDYGVAQNRKLYGQAFPPLYPVERVKIPVYIYVGDRDITTDPTDIAMTASKLKNLKRFHIFEGFSHADIVGGLGVEEVIFRPIIETLKQIFEENI